MPRLLIIGTAASALLFSTPALAQFTVQPVLGESDRLIASSEYSQSRAVVIDALNNNPSEAEREVLIEQLDKISAATPYYIKIDASSTFTTGTRQDMWLDRLNWVGVPHYTDQTLTVKKAQASLINSVSVDAGYRFDLSPDVNLSVGLDGQIYFYEETDFMEAWVGEAYAELDLSIGPVLSNTRLSFAQSSKSREKVDFNPNVPRVPGLYSYNAEQDLGFKLAKDQVIGLEITYRQGDETSNVQFPGTAFEHLTVETYYDATWANTLDTRLYGFGQAAVSDPEYVGFLAFGAGVEMELDLPVGFSLGGDLQYRTQTGMEPYPDRTENLDLDIMQGSFEIQNGHFRLGGFAPYLNASFSESTATYAEYDRSDLAFGAGIRLGF